MVIKDVSYNAEELEFSFLNGYNSLGLVEVE